jgi:hypothetical protein
MYFVPLSALLWLGMGRPVAASVLLIGAPIWFASLIFSHSFREAPNPAVGREVAARSGVQRLGHARLARVDSAPKCVSADRASCLQPRW